MKSEPNNLVHLPGGLRLVCVNTPAANVEYFGIVVDAGSRDDPHELHGLAHFVEHTIFKGTVHRRSCHIINRMESCGGELNAFTTKQSTTVYSVFPAGNLQRAAELISDLVIHSTFPRQELDKEREVVADEISSYLDIPAEAVVDDFEDLLFAGSPLGHNILGNRDALERFDSAICRRYLSELYVASNMVVFYSGPLKAEKVTLIVERYFADLSAAPAVKAKQIVEPVVRFDKSRDLGIHQSHTIVGTRVCDMFDDRRYALSLLVNILGGPGMNSLLNVALREKRGLVYTVDASLSFLPDCGIFTVYYGCDADDSVRCRRLVDRSIAELAERPMSQRRFYGAVRQYLGQMTVMADNRENAVMSTAKQALYRNRLFTAEEMRERILALTPADLCNAASMILPAELSSLTFY